MMWTSAKREGVDRMRTGGRKRGCFLQTSFMDDPLRGNSTVRHLMIDIWIEHQTGQQL